jgi:hypothetical protein
MTYIREAVYLRGQVAKTEAIVRIFFTSFEWELKLQPYKLHEMSHNEC